MDDLRLILSRLRGGLLLSDPAAVEALIGPVAGAGGRGR